MSWNLIHLSCERWYETEGGEKPDGPEPGYRLINVPSGMANQIARWYRRQGWDVIEELA